MKDLAYAVVNFSSVSEYRNQSSKRKIECMNMWDISKEGTIISSISNSICRPIDHYGY